MNLLDLPQDVLIPIVELLTQQDALQLASVSRLAHTLAMPRVLFHVDLGGARSLGVAYQKPQAKRCLPKMASLVSLILENPAADYAHDIRSIVLTWDTIDPLPQFAQGYVAHVPTFARALGHAINLRKLEIHKAESVMKFSSAMADMLASYDRLQYIRLQDVAERAMSLLARTRSRLREVVLENVHSEFEFDLLRSHAETLEVLRMTAFAVERPPSIGDIWRRVHTLQFIGYNGSRFPLTSLPRAFPRVRRLSLTSGSTHRHMDMDPTMSGPFAWPSLEILEVSPWWQLHLISPVRVLRIDAFISDGFAYNILQHARPVVLSLDLCYESELLPRTLAAPEGLRALRYLQLRGAHYYRRYNPHTRGVTHAGPLMDALTKLADRGGLPLHALWLFYTDADWDLQDTTPTSQESAVKSIAGLYPTLELIGLRRRDRIGFCSPPNLLPVETTTIWYRVHRPLNGRGDDIVVEAAPSAETARITKYVENLGREA